jgi:hypothetical protein
MGRGRQKAKDAKIARELKYTNHGGDLRALERELLHGPEAPVASAVDTAVVEDDEDLYDRWASVDDDDEDDDEDVAR